MTSRRIASLVLVVGMAASRAAHADGYFEGSKGARAAGRAGAFTVRADDLSAVRVNPSGLAHIEGTLIHVGNRFSRNTHEFTRQPTLDWGNTVSGMAPLVEFGEASNRHPWQLIDPIAGGASDLGFRAWHFALAVYSPPGVGRQEFAVDGGQRYLMVSRDARVVNYAASVAWAEGDVFGAGISLVWVTVPTLEYQLVIDGNTFPGDAHPVSGPLDMLATVDGSDLFTFNAIVGAFYRPAPFLEIGLSGQVIPSEIEAESALSIDPLATMIDEQVVLRRDGERADDVSLILPLPITAHLGIRYIHRRDGRELFDVELDVGYEGWSAVRSFTLETRGLVAELFGQRIALGDIEVDKRWRDTISVQLGGDYSLIADLLTARGGLFYESALARPEYEHVDFVGGRQLGGALGVSVFVGGVEVAIAYEYRHTPEVSVTEDDARVYQEAPGSQCAPPYTDPDLCHPAYLGQPSPAVNAGAYRADSNIVSVDVLYRF